MRLADRDAVWQHLKKNQIGCEVYYPLPMHLQECFARLGYHKGDFPESEKAALTTLALPVYPELTPVQRQHVADTLASYYQERQLARPQAA